MAFHPNYPTDARVFISYTSDRNGLESRVSVFRTTNGGATLNPATEQVLLAVDREDDIHNGGHLVFGPDGYLYIGLGDGGGAGDQHGDPGQRAATHHPARQTAANRCGTALRLIPCRRATVFSRRERKRSLPSRRPRQRQLPRDLCMGLTESLALELRSRERGPVAR